VAITNGGTLEIPAAGDIGGTGVGSGYITLDNGTLRNTNSGVGGTFLTGNRGIILGPGNGTIDLPGSAAAVVIYTSGSFTGTGTMTKTGVGAFRNTTPTAVQFTKLVVKGGLWQGAADTIFGAAPTGPDPSNITLDGGGISTNAGFTLSVNRGIV